MRKFKSVGGRVKLRLPQHQNILILKYKHLGIEMVRCPAGSFMMGTPEYLPGHKKNQIQHQVTISKSFFIGRYKVSQKLYRAVEGYCPSTYKFKDFPVENISWYEAKDFCDKLNKYVKNIPHGYKFDLPTEAQWEYACKASDTPPLRDDNYLTSKKWYLNKLDWHGKYTSCVICSKGKYERSIGIHKPNLWGIFDMFDYVCEWCEDWYGNLTSKYITDPVCFTPIIDNFFAIEEYHRVVRGFTDLRYANNYSIYHQSSERLAYLPNRNDSLIGFRVALVPINK